MAGCGSGSGSGNGTGGAPGFINANDAKLMAKNSPIVWAEIAAIQQAILSSLCGCNCNGGDGSGSGNGNGNGGSCVTVGGDTPMTFVDGVEQVEVIEPGRCYCPIQPVVKFSHKTGMGAKAYAVVSNSGVVTEVVVTSGGGGYINLNPVVFIEHPTGVGFYGVVMVNHAGVILGVSVQQGGILYGDIYPTVEITDPTGKGSGVETSLTIDEQTCGIEKVDVIKSGVGYSKETYGKIIPVPGSHGEGAIIDVDVRVNPYKTDPYQYYLAYIGESTDCNLVSQLDQVKSYFLSLGYQVKIEVNPDTGSTIQWVVCWC